MAKIEKRSYPKENPEMSLLPSEEKAPLKILEKDSGKRFGKKGPMKAKKLVQRKPLFLARRKYIEKVLQLTRVTKVVKGGKRMSFRALVIVGDTKHKVGVGIGRADDAGSAIQKAVINGKKAFVNVPITFNLSIPHTTKLSYRAASIFLSPAPKGTGIIAGAAVRSVLELAGVQNILAKQFGSSSLLNNAKATILALNSLNEKIAQGQAQTGFRKAFYGNILAKYKKYALFV